MPRSAIATRVGAGLFLVVFLLFSGLKTAHDWYAHADHAVHPAHCGDHDGNRAHWHDDRYEPDNCQLCAFWFATPLLPDVVAQKLQPVVPVAAIMIGRDEALTGGYFCGGQGRAPPHT